MKPSLLHFPDSSRRFAIAGCLFFLLFFQPAFSAAGRPIISNNTVKTADGQLLRGCHAHIGRVTAEILTFFAKMDNVKKLRDEMHMNVIRICCITPGWGSAGTVDQALSYADPIINNCDSAGIYAILNYHGPVLQDGSDWDITNFWTKASARYKDRPFVMYNLVNEQFQAPGAVTWLSNLYKKVRAAAPNTMIFAYEPVGVPVNFATWLKSSYPAEYGFSWDQGKDAWSYHTYIGTPETHLLEVKDAGLPQINTEFSFREEGWPVGLEQYQDVAEFMEKYGISWMVWQEWQSRNADQLQAVRDYLLTDAVAKGYAWWTMAAPSVPQNLAAAALSSYDVKLTWSAPASVGGGIMNYIVFRNGREVGWPTEASFIDTGLSAGSTCSYEVMALAKCSKPGPRTASVTVTTPVDNTPPTAVLVSGVGDGARIHVVFSEKVDRTGAQTAANYVIAAAGGGSVAVSSAVLGADQKTVTLTTSGLTQGTSYSLSIGNVRDLAAAPNVIAPGSSYPFSCAPGVTRIRFFPRATFAARMVSGVFEAANGPPETGPYVMLYRIQNQPVENAWNEVTESQWTAQTGAANFDRGYRYFRYRGYAGACNVAEIEFYYGTVKATGTVFGSPGSYQNSGNDYTKAFDGNTATYFDYSQDYGGYTGLDLGARGAAGARQAVGRSPAGLRIAVQDGRAVRISGAPAHETARISIYDLRGNLLRSLTGANGGVVDITGPHDALPAQGRYVLRINAGGQEITRGIFLMR